MTLSYYKLCDELNTLTRYTVGATVVAGKVDPFAGFGLMGAFSTAPAAYNGVKWLYTNRGNYASAWQAAKAANEAKNLENAALKGKNFLETTINTYRSSKLDELSRMCKDNPFFDESKRLIQDAKSLRGSAQTAAIENIEQKIAQARLDTHNAKINGSLKPTSRTGKIWAGTKKYTGMQFISGKTKGWAATSKTFRTVSKVANGNALFAGISLACEAPEIYQTYKELGAGKGTKQLAKSTTVVAAETTGFALGAKAGGIIGAEVGAAIGSIVPGIGNAVGAVVGGLIGIGCGLLGGWLAGKGARAMVGKSELQKHNDEEAEKMLAILKENPNAKEELLQIAKQKLENDSPYNAEAQKALTAYNSIAKSVAEEQENNRIKEERKARMYNNPSLANLRLLSNLA